MKKILICICSFLLSPLLAQTTKIPKGNYTANEKGFNIVLSIQDDNSFHFSYLHGVMEIQNDSVVKLNTNKEKNTSGFKLAFNYDEKAVSDKIKIKFENIPDYDWQNFFIGTQNINEEPEYLSIGDIKKNNDLIGVEAKFDTIHFELKRSNFLYLAYENYSLKTEISKYKIPENISEITVNHTSNISENINLQGLYKEKTKEIIISENGKGPLKFVLEDKNAKQKTADIKPIDVIVKTGWTFPRKESKEIYNVEEAAEKISSEEKPYAFKHFKSKSLQESLTQISKTPAKFLVVSFDLKNKKRNEIFDEFIKNSEKALTDYMYYSYQESYDHFDYYLATEKDKKILSKYKIKSEKELLLFNSDGNLIYHTKGDLDENKDKFSNYENIFIELNESSKKMQFDKIMLDKNATNKQILTLLNTTTDFKFPTDIINVETTKITPAVIIDDKSKDPAKIEIDNDSEKNLEKETEVVEVAPYPADYFDKIKDKENLYQLKSSRKTVIQKWNDIAIQYKQTNKYDSQYIKTCKKELGDNGFSRELLQDESRMAKSTDFEVLDYLFANYKAILKEEKGETYFDENNVKQDTIIEQVSVDQAIYEPYFAGINTVLEDYFQRTTKVEYGESPKELRDKTLKYYKKYKALNEFKSRQMRAYLNALYNNFDSSEHKKEYFEVFDSYFNKIISPNKSVIENLDIDYTANEDNEKYWQSYKNDFALDSNQAAWEVVKVGKASNWIQQAIKWSETSLQLDKDNHYFWDTLARLYYLNGQKEKAILTQQKAIALDKYSEKETEYKNVLQEMEKGVYTLPANE